MSCHLYFAQALHLIHLSLRSQGFFSWPEIAPTGQTLEHMLHPTHLSETTSYAEQRLAGQFRRNCRGYALHSSRSIVGWCHVLKRFAKPAKSTALMFSPESISFSISPSSPLAGSYALQYLKHALCTDSAGRAFSAGFINGKVECELCYVNHTVVFIHYNQIRSEPIMEPMAVSES